MDGNIASSGGVQYQIEVQTINLGPNRIAVQATLHSLNEETVFTSPYFVGSEDEKIQLVKRAQTVIREHVVALN